LALELLLQINFIYEKTFFLRYKKLHFPDEKNIIFESEYCLLCSKI